MYSTDKGVISDLIKSKSCNDWFWFSRTSHAENLRDSGVEVVVGLKTRWILGKS